MKEIVENSIERFEVKFDHSIVSPIILRPNGAENGEYIELGAGGESAAIAISVVFRSPNENLPRDLIFVFENISGDPIFKGEHVDGTELEYGPSDFSTGDGLLSGFSETKLTITVGPTREEPFKAHLILSKTYKHKRRSRY